MAMEGKFKCKTECQNVTPACSLPHSPDDKIPFLFALFSNSSTFSGPTSICRSSNNLTFSMRDSEYLLLTLLAILSLSFREVASFFTLRGTIPRDCLTGAPRGFLLSSINCNYISFITRKYIILSFYLSIELCLVSLLGRSTHKSTSSISTNDKVDISQDNEWSLRHWSLSCNH